MNHDQDLDMKARTTERNHAQHLALKPGEKRRRNRRNMLNTICVCVGIAAVLALIDGAIGVHPK